MAKKSTKTKSNTESKIIRNFDIYSMEKRVYDMDNSSRRSYDLFSLEKRIYDLEIGGTPGPTPPTPVVAEIINNYSGYNTPVTYTATKNMRMYLCFTSAITSSAYTIKVNDTSIITDLNTNMIGNAPSSYLSYIDLNEGDVLYVLGVSTNRYFCGIGV